MNPAASHGGEIRRVRVRVVGRVQGVGYRPWVYARARALGLTGCVFNDVHGVVVEAQGARVDDLVAELRTGGPPTARVDAVTVESCAPVTLEGPFEIRHSVAGAHASAAIGPDLAPCEACLTELFTPEDRRHLYPFLNCTHCGPRYTITRALPYDRPNTALAGFPLCEACGREYADPLDRRFHAQPLACPTCGPRLRISTTDAWQVLRGGGTVAFKGVGGFQLVCNALDEAAVARLRTRKHRDAKPFAVMVLNAASAALFAQLGDQELALLQDPTRPVVVLPVSQATTRLAPSVAPGLNTLGVMLPATPLHHLLFFEALGRPSGTQWLTQPHALAWVATSANVHGEPLLISNEAAHQNLAAIADVVLDHNRDILTRVDDSVMRVVAGQPRFIRRARGFVPDPVALDFDGPCVLALGGHQKTTVTLTRGKEAFVSQHVGTLDNAATRAFFQETVAHLQKTLDVAPELVAHDLHPDFFSTHLALQQRVPTVAVQHHHAHVASVLAEHQHSQPVVALVLDGFGLGTDGGLWGGELLGVDGARLERLGHLRPLRLPGGGDLAARQPWRMALSVAVELGLEDRVLPGLEQQGATRTLVDLVKRGVGAPWSSSAGRVFDAAAGLLGICPVNQCDAQAPMLLEALVRQAYMTPGLWRILDQHGKRVLDVGGLLAALVEREPQDGAELFHGTFAAALVDFAAPVARANGGVLVLGGGCLMNAVLTAALVDGFARCGVKTLLPAQVPANDGGLSLGQAAVASWQHNPRGAPCAWQFPRA